jgi:hypothetical protein
MRRSLATLGLIPVMALGALTASPVAASASVVSDTPSASSGAIVKFKNCTSLNKVYKHGVGLKGAKDKHGRRAHGVMNFKVSTPLYKANRKLDRDKDGIACEKR